MNLLDRPKTIAVLLAVVALGYAGWTTYQQTASNDPDRQVFVRGDVPPHRLNLWIQPQPVKTGEVTVQVGFDFVNLMNDRIEDLKLKFSGPDGEKLKLNPTFSEAGTYAGRYHATTTLNRSGAWTLRVQATVSDTTKTNTFDISVSD